MILRDVRTAACHKYRQFASLQIASAPFYYERRFCALLIGFTTPEIFCILKKTRYAVKFPFGSEQITLL